MRWIAALALVLLGGDKPSLSAVAHSAKVEGLSYQAWPTPGFEIAKSPNH